MTASLPSDVQAVFARFVTSEFTAMDAGGQPITWPVIPLYEPGGRCIDVTTGLGYPKKAHDARANPLVALLFSDATGSGLPGAPMVLVQGSTEVDDRDLDANRNRYAREVAEKLPQLGRVQPPDPIRRLIGWYFTRIYIHVRPERVYVWPSGDVNREPALYDAHLEEVRSGHSEEPERFHAPPAGGTPAWDERILALGSRYRTAVVSLISPDGFPFSVRAPVRPDAAAQRIVIDSDPQGVPLQPGLACLTAHATDRRDRRESRFPLPLSRQPELHLRGDLTLEQDTWVLVPHQLVGGFAPARSRVAALRASAARARGAHHTAQRELGRRR